MFVEGDKKKARGDMKMEGIELHAEGNCNRFARDEIQTRKNYYENGRKIC